MKNWLSCLYFLEMKKKNIKNKVEPAPKNKKYGRNISAKLSKKYSLFGRYTLNGVKIKRMKFIIIETNKIKLFFIINKYISFL